MVSGLQRGAGPDTTLSLDDIGLACGTDKSSLDHSYTLVYEQYFDSLRHEPVKLLELGVYQGASLRMWDEYFTNPDSDIIGIDHAVSDLSIGRGRVRVYQGDQCDVPGALSFGWLPDIVIDDASHLSSKTIESFQLWFSLLRPGGLYVVEDLVTSYYLGGPAESDPDPDAPWMERPTAMQFFRRLADEVVGCPQEYRRGYAIEWLHFHPNLMICRKAS